MQPNDDNYQVLLKNIKTNNKENQIIPFKIALNSFSDKLRIPNKADRRWKNLKEQVKMTPRLGTYQFTDVTVETKKLSEMNLKFNFILSRISSNSLDIIEDIQNYLKDNNVKMLLEWYPFLTDEKHQRFFNLLTKSNSLSFGKSSSIMALIFIGEFILSIL